MSEIVLKTGKRKTTVPRSIIRRAVYLAYIANIAGKSNSNTKTSRADAKKIRRVSIRKAS